VRDQAESDAATALDLLLGRYVRGEALVYRGSVSASDTESIFNTIPPPDPPAYTDHTMTSVEAIAGLVIGGADPQATLQLVSLSEEEIVIFQQIQSVSGVTKVNGILSLNEFGGPVAPCSGCAPDLLARPTTIAWTAQDAVWTDTSLAADYHVRSSVNLAVESPCDLTWDEMVAVDAYTYAAGNQGLGKFVGNGNEMVFHQRAVVTTANPSAHGACDGQQVPYSIDLYVNLSDLSVYGARNYVAGAPVSICAI
jgi:hypothetical protein